MVPELSRSADHLFHDEEEESNRDGKSSGYYKGNLLKTPESLAGCVENLFVVFFLNN